MTFTPFQVALIAPLFAPPTGTITSTETADVMAASGNVTYTGQIASTEAGDVSACTGTVTYPGVAASTEAADVMAAFGFGRPLVVGTAQWASRRLVRLANSRGLERTFASRRLSR